VRLLAALKKTNVAADNGFQSAYRRHWQLNAARLSTSFLVAYFGLLEATKQENAATVESVARRLLETPTHGASRMTLQFSFASKLVHMVQPNQPIYDSMVERFFFFASAKEGESVDAKLKRLLQAYKFLGEEYRRVLTEGLLADAIARFRARFEVGTEYTDAKVIDTLIWKFVSFAGKGALPNRTIVYR
jgi:hypothetical protein